MPACEDASMQPLIRLRPDVCSLQQWQETLNQAVASHPMASLALSTVVAVAFSMLLLDGSELLYMVGVVGWILSGPPLIITLLFVASGLEEPAAAKSPCLLESLPKSFCIQFMSGAKSSFESLFSEPLPVRVVVFYHTVDSSAHVLEELQHWDQLAGEDECCGKIVLCNTESAEKAISVSAKIGVHKAFHVHALRPRGLPRANPLALLLDASGRILKVEDVKLSDARRSLISQSSSLRKHGLNTSGPQHLLRTPSHGQKQAQDPAVPGHLLHPPRIPGARRARLCLLRLSGNSASRCPAMPFPGSQCPPRLLKQWPQ
ncbi:unnamed protein product, partial [Symbiodinium sp. CCMP2456]